MTCLRLQPPPHTPPHKGEGDIGAALAIQTTSAGNAQRERFYSSLWGGVRGGCSPRSHAGFDPAYAAAGDRP